VLAFSALQRLAKILLAPSSFSMRPDDLGGSQVIQSLTKEDKLLKEAELKQNNIFPSFAREQGRE
jgi:hypothetical protein